MCTMLGMALGGWMSGKIFDLTGSYHAAFVNGIAWNVLNLSIAFMLLRRSRRQAASLQPAMNIDTSFLFVTQLAMGFALAACVGLRAFLPLLAAGPPRALRLRGPGPSFEWMHSTPALVVFGSALVFEVLADKVPVLDHALHAVEAFVKPAAATLLAASLFTNLDPMMAMVLGSSAAARSPAPCMRCAGGTRVLSTAPPAASQPDPVALRRCARGGRRGLRDRAADHRGADRDRAGGARRAHAAAR
jgi:hypothetical protein